MGPQTRVPLFPLWPSFNKAYQILRVLVVFVMFICFKISSWIFEVDFTLYRQEKNMDFQIWQMKPHTKMCYISQLMMCLFLVWNIQMKNKQNKHFLLICDVWPCSKLQSHFQLGRTHVCSQHWGEVFSQQQSALSWATAHIHCQLKGTTFLKTHW